MIAALIILMILTSGDAEALRIFDPADAKKKIVGAVQDATRAEAVAREVDLQIAVYRQKAVAVAKSEQALADLLVQPGTTKAAFQSKLNSFNDQLVRYDQELLNERNAMRKLMTQEEWDKAFGGVEKQD